MCEHRASEIRMKKKGRLMAAPMVSVFFYFARKHACSVVQLHRGKGVPRTLSSDAGFRGCISPCSRGVSNSGQPMNSPAIFFPCKLPSNRHSEFIICYSSTVRNFSITKPWMPIYSISYQPFSRPNTSTFVPVSHSATLALSPEGALRTLMVVLPVVRPL